MPWCMPTSTVLVHEMSVPIVDWPEELSGLRIAHVSDLHFRRWNETLRHAQERLVDIDYDLLLVTGDFGTVRRHWQKAADLTQRFFGPLIGLSAIYAVLGNHDDPRIADAPDMPVTFLRNESKCFEFNGAALNIAGVEQNHRKAGNLGATLSSCQPGLPTILMAHYPSTVFRIPPDRVQLVLSGHTHGGQIRVPWLGCVWANDRIPRRMARGLHNVDGISIHVSAGIGASLPIPVRVYCPPEVSVLTLRPSGPAISLHLKPAKTRKIRRTMSAGV